MSLLFVCLSLIESVLIQLTPISVIKGKVIDPDNTPIEAAVVIIRDRQNEIITYQLTNSEGEFSIQLTEMSPCLVEVSHMSYELYREEIVQSDNIDLSIRLIPKNETLSASSVEASIPPIVFRNGALVVNISNDQTAQNEYLDRVFRSLPGVMVEDKSGISLNGLPASISIDGVPQHINGQLVNDVLSSYPASSVEEIELVSTPGGEHSASSGAIINIVTKKKKEQGHYFSIGMSGNLYDAKKVDGQGNIVYIMTNPDIDINANITLRNDYTSRTIKEVTSYLTNSLLLTQSKNNEEICDAAFGTINVRKRNVLKGDLRFNLLFYTDKSNYEGNEQRVLSERIDVKRLYHGHDDLWSSNLSYLYSGKHNRFSISYGHVYGGNRITDNNIYRNDNVVPYINYSSKLIGRKQLVKGDYTNTTFHDLTLQTGFELEIGKLNDDILYDESHSSLENHFSGDEIITSAYASVRRKFANYWDVYGSIRYENTSYNVEQIGIGKTQDNYGDLFPFLQLTYSSPSGNYRSMAAIVSSINRPEYSYMVPGSRIRDDYFVTLGNPNISPTYNYGIVLQQYIMKAASLSIRLEQRKNLTGPVYKDMGEYTQCQYDNYADENRFYVNLYLPFSFFARKLTGRISSSASYHSLFNLRNGYETNGRSEKYWGNSNSIYLNYQPNKRLGFGFWTTVVPATRTPQIDASFYWTSDMSVNYAFGEKEKYSVSLDVEDIFNTLQKHQRIYYGNIHKEVSSKYNSRLISLSFKYRFETGKKTDQTASQDPNDTSRFGKK